jgi:hypothetical protein
MDRATDSSDLAERRMVPTAMKKPLPLRLLALMVNYLIFG